MDSLLATHLIGSLRVLEDESSVPENPDFSTRTLSYGNRVGRGLVWEEDMSKGLSEGARVGVDRHSVGMGDVEGQPFTAF